MIRVVVADDQALVRGGFRALLDAQADITVVGEAGDGDEAVRMALQVQPDVVLMDIRMPGVDGLAATRRIAAEPRLAAVKVVILTTFDLDEYVFEAIRAGAAGFLVKDTEPAELLRAVRTVVSGGALLSPGVTRRLIEDGRENFVLRSPLHLPMPTRMLQGTADQEVSTATARRLLDHATGPDIRLTMVKDADHRFSSPRCLKLIARAIEEVS